MATIRRKKPEPFALLQRDPGPWSPILLYWQRWASSSYSGW